MTESVNEMAARLGVNLDPARHLEPLVGWSPPKPRRRSSPVPRLPRRPICELGPRPALSGVEEARELARAWVNGGQQKLAGEHVPDGWLELGAYQRHGCGVRVREARNLDLRWGLIDRTDRLHRCPA